MPYQSMDFPQLFAVAQQLREGRQRQSAFELEMSQRKDALAREGALRQALSAYYQRGDESALRAQFPQEFAKIQEGKLDLEAKRAALGKTTAEASELQRKVGIERAGSTARTLYGAAQVVRSNPQASGMIEGKLRELAKSGQLDLTEEQIGIVTPERLEQLSALADKRAEGLVTPELTPAQREIAPELSPAYAAHPERALTDPGYAAAMEKRRKEGGLKIDLGKGSEATTANVTALQKELIEGQNALNALGTARDKFYPTFGTKTDQAKALVAKLKGWAGIASKSDARFIAERDELFKILREAHLKFQVAVTGSAGSDKQMEMIAQAALDPDLPPEILRPRIANMYRSLQARTDALGMYLERGVPTNPQQREAFAKEYTERVKQSEDRSFKERWNALRKSGMDKATTIDRLYEEGYINEQRAADLAVVLK